MRTNIRLSDLERGAGERGPWKLMNVKVPDTVARRIDEAAAALGCAKTAIVIALINEGLDAFAERRQEFPSAPVRRRRR